MSINVTRTKDVGVLLESVSPYLPLHGFDPIEWIQQDQNICLTDGSGNISLFEEVSPNVFEGHYFFKTRGKNALILARTMLSIFMQDYQPYVIKGLTPLEHLGARWLSRQLGFKSYGAVQTPVGPCELFILTKEDWENKINE